MFKPMTNATFAIAAALTAAGALAFVMAPSTPAGAESPVTTAPLTDTSATWRGVEAPQACRGEVWPYQSSHCIAAIMADNGTTKRHVRVISLYEATNTPLAQAYASLADDLRPTR